LPQTNLSRILGLIQNEAIAAIYKNRPDGAILSEAIKRG
jgi:hypothetical protein